MNIDPARDGLLSSPLITHRTSPSVVSRIFAKEGSWRLLVGSLFAVVAIGLMAMLVFAQQQAPVSEEKSPAGLGSDEPIQPIERIAHLDLRKVQLGRKLFHETRLSHNNQLSCSTCHNLSFGGTDRRVKPIGIYGTPGTINTPTVFNSGLNFSQFWDGRVETLEKQADEPILSPAEMGSTWPEVIAKLSGSADYQQTFQTIYDDGLQITNVKDSIAEFERSLSTPNSRFDRFLRHDSSAITAEEQQGYVLFKSYGCASCHQGVNVGGNMYQKMGVMLPYFKDKALTKADLGRFNITGDPRDKHVFKVPSLRNVELTAPYFHNGSAATLEDAVAVMAKYQLGHPLTRRESSSIVAFLKTLTGQLEGNSL